jgi:hypothetical protein
MVYNTHIYLSPTGILPQPLCIGQSGENGSRYRLGNRLEQVSSYENHPLKPGKIRLLSLGLVTEPRFSWLSPSSCLQLRTSVRTLEENTTDYLAVSYVWGIATTSVRVMCNGTALFVTPNVYEMLEYLEPRRKLLWIDAICIDQANLDEKAAQIPLMHKVYTQAELVIVWLGASDPTITTFMQDFPGSIRARASLGPKGSR